MPTSSKNPAQAGISPNSVQKVSKKALKVSKKGPIRSLMGHRRPNPFHLATPLYVDLVIWLLVNQKRPSRVQIQRPNHAYHVPCPRPSIETFCIISLSLILSLRPNSGISRWLCWSKCCLGVCPLSSRPWWSVRSTRPCATTRSGPILDIYSTITVYASSWPLYTNSTCLSPTSTPRKEENCCCPYRILPTNCPPTLSGTPCVL